MKIIIALLFMTLTLTVSAQSNPNSHKVKGYTKKNGTYVAPHYSTNPNKTQKDNYSTKGNYNYHNGRTGTRKAKY